MPQLKFLHVDRTVAVHICARKLHQPVVRAFELLELVGRQRPVAVGVSELEDRFVPRDVPPFEFFEVDGAIVVVVRVHELCDPLVVFVEALRVVLGGERLVALLVAQCQDPLVLQLLQQRRQGVAAVERRVHLHLAHVLGDQVAQRAPAAVGLVPRQWQRVDKYNWQLYLALGATRRKHFLVKRGPAVGKEVGEAVLGEEGRQLHETLLDGRVVRVRVPFVFFHDGAGGLLPHPGQPAEWYWYADFGAKGLGDWVAEVEDGNAQRQQVPHVAAHDAGRDGIDANLHRLRVFLYYLKSILFSLLFEVSTIV